MIFVDSSYWVALYNRRDDRHQDAGRLLQSFAHEALLTTNEVRGETWTFQRRRAGHTSAVQFLDALDASPRATVVRVSEPEQVDALAWLRTRSEREYSWVDATSFAVMRHRRVRDAFAFAGDFSAAGFIELR